MAGLISHMVYKFADNTKLELGSNLHTLCVNITKSTFIRIFQKYVPRSSSKTTVWLKHDNLLAPQIYFETGHLIETSVGQIDMQFKSQSQRK